MPDETREDWNTGNWARLVCCVAMVWSAWNGIESAALAQAPEATQPELASKLFQQAPTIRSNPIQRVPLVAIVEFESAVPSQAVLEISDGRRKWEQPHRGEARTQHRLAVMGMRPGLEHSIRVRLSTPEGAFTERSRPLRFKTPPLPDSFPPLRILEAQAEKMEPGLTLFAVNLWIDDASMLDYGYIIALDASGAVVWYCHTQDRIADLRVLSNGNLLYQHGSYRYAYEIDLLGRDIRSWYGSNLTLAPNPEAVGVAVDTLHHDILELPNGNFLTLATELRHREHFPSSEKNAQAPWGPAEVVSDAIVEFRPSDGQIVRRLHLADVLDPQRFGYMSLGSYWKDKYDQHLSSPSRDWSHANALVFLADEQAVLVSLRHLDCLIKLDWPSQEIRWILGDPSGWGEAWQRFLLKPVGNVQWSYHHHAPRMTPRGTILLYDNGNFRSRPYEPIIKAEDNHSRVVEYRVDESAMTVEQVDEIRSIAGESFYCPFYGEAERLPRTGNLLLTNGGHIESVAGTPSDAVPGQRQWARIVELTAGETPEKVFDVVCDSGPGSPYGWSIYRAERIANGFDDFKVIPPISGEAIEPQPRGPVRKRSDRVATPSAD